MNLCCMCSVSKTSLCPLLLLSPWHCYPLTSSKAMVCTNTNCYAPPSPPLSPHTYTFILGESDNNITEDDSFPLLDMGSWQLREFLTRFNTVMNFSAVFHSLPFFFFFTAVVFSHLWCDSIDFSVKPGHVYCLLYLSLNMFLLTAMGKTQNNLIYCLNLLCTCKMYFIYSPSCCLCAYLFSEEHKRWYWFCVFYSVNWRLRTFLFFYLSTNPDFSMEAALMIVYQGISILKIKNKDQDYL